MKSNSKYAKNMGTLLAGVAVAAFAFAATPNAYAAKDGHSTDSHATDGHSDSHTDSGGKSAGKKRKGKSGAAKGHGGKGSKSLRDVFREIEDFEEAESTKSTDDASDSKKASSGAKKGGKKAGKSTTAKGKGGTKKGGKSVDKVTAKGKKPSGHDDTTVTSEDEDSDRPEWAGTPGKDGKPGRPSQTAGTKKGDLFGDMYVLLRDENGLPIYTQLADGTWVVQPIDADGNPIALDEEGHPVDEDATVEVELGRLNVGRAPLSVLSQRYEEVLKYLEDATEATLDPAGRLVLTIDGETKTIDAPLENLAIYVELMNTGTLTGVPDASIFTGDLANLVDGTLTVDDMVEAKSFLAAASDKFGSIGLDSVEYINAILALEGTLTDQADKVYVDYSSYTYDREATYKDVTAEVLVLENGVWVPTTVNIYDAVFASADYDGSNAAAFAQATDDARAVIEFVHEYEVPPAPVTQ